MPSGPLLRIGHDHYLPGLRRIVDTVDTVGDASGGETRLFIQIIDFLAIRRRPDPQKFLQRFLAITDAHRRALDDMSLSDDDVRSGLCAMSRDELTPVLSPAEQETLKKAADMVDV